MILSSFNWCQLMAKENKSQQRLLTVKAYVQGMRNVTIKTLTVQNNVQNATV